MTGYFSKPVVPASVADLDLNVVVASLSNNECNVTSAANDLGVPASDLRRLMWATPKLQDQAFEVVEAQLDLAEANLYEDLRSDDRRIRAAATFYTLRNRGLAKRRGWITSASAGVDLTVNAGNGVQEFTFSWRTAPPKVEGSDGSAGPLIGHDPSPPGKE